jgi:hypothetical protein
VQITGYTATLYWRLGTSLVPVASCTTAGNSNASRTCLFTGLSNTSVYVVRVSARNTSGIVGPQSSVSAPISPTLRRGVVVAGLLATGKLTAIGFTPRVASSPATKWTARVYASASSTRVLASCTATAKSGVCTVGKLVRGRTYFVTVVKTGSKYAVIKAAPRAKVRVR